MPGKPGAGGPVPKPSSQRRRQNKDVVPRDVAPAGRPADLVAVPTPSDLWHPIARDWFESLAESGQCRYFEPSDWQMARLGAEMMSSLCSADKPSAQMLASLLALTSSLLSTEGDRRRLRLELARGPQIDADDEQSAATVTDIQARLLSGQR